MDQDEKVRENRLRRMANRRSLRLVKSRMRDRSALDYGRYRIETADGSLPPGTRHGYYYWLADLDAVEKWLLTSPRR